MAILGNDHGILATFGDRCFSIAGVGTAYGYVGRYLSGYGRPTTDWRQDDRNYNPCMGLLHRVADDRWKSTIAPDWA